MPYSAILNVHSNSNMQWNIVFPRAMALHTKSQLFKNTQSEPAPPNNGHKTKTSLLPRWTRISSPFRPKVLATIIGHVHNTFSAKALFRLPQNSPSTNLRKKHENPLNVNLQPPTNNTRTSELSTLPCVLRSHPSHNNTHSRQLRNGVGQHADADDDEKS